MKFEHFALNVEQPVEMADWYCKNLGMTIVSQQKQLPFMTFLADASGRVVMELFFNNSADVTNFENLHHLTMHMAFQVEDARKLSEKLQKEGATFLEEVNPEEGTILVMLKNPWNIPLQLCQRKNKMPLG